MPVSRATSRRTSTGASPSPQQLGTNLRAGENNEQRKRRKVSQACEICRARKSRCDGVKPVCGECAQRPNQKSPCHYAATASKTVDQGQYVSDLLARIADLEAQVASNNCTSSLHARIRELEAQNLSLTSKDLDQQNVQYVRAQSEGFPVAIDEHLRAIPATQSPDQGLGTEPSPVDAMGAASHPDREPRDKDAYFYGGSSTVSLMQQVQATIAGRMYRADGSMPMLSTRNSTGIATPYVCSTIDQIALTLPPRSLVDRVIACYWGRVHHLYPFVNQATFMLAYEQIWTSEASRTELSVSSIGMLGSRSFGPESVVFHSALNSMLALGSQFMDLPSSDRKKLAELFAEQARSLFKLDLFDNGSLAVVQSLLLMAQYFQSTTYPTRCWNCTGIACRVAQGLGLHAESTETYRTLSLLDLEMRRRVWHGCVMLDTVVSMTLGRPLMLYGSPPVPLPQGVDVEEEAQSQEEHTSFLSFYNESIKLYRIMADVLLHIYGQHDAQTDSKDKEHNFDVTLELDARISKLETQLPSHLQSENRLALQTETQASMRLAQESFVLEARYVHLRMLLYRPIFVRLCGSICARGVQKDNEISLLIAQSLAKACVKQSMKLIDVVHGSLNANATGAWWYNAFYTRNAGTIVLLAMLCDAVIQEPTSQELKLAWNQCQDVFRLLRTFSPTVAAYQKGLEALHCQVTIAKRKNGSAVHSPNAASGVPSEWEADFVYDFGEDFAESAFVITDDFQWPAGADAALFNEILGLDT